MMVKDKQKTQTSILSILTGIYIIVWYLNLGLRVPFLGSIRFEFLLGSFLLIMSFLSKPTDEKISSDGLVTITFWFIAVLGIYTIFSFDRTTSNVVYIDRVVKFAMLSLFITKFCKTHNALRLFIACLFIAWLKMGQEGFVGWATGSLMWQNQGIPRLHGPVGKYGHPNSFSGFAVGMLPFVLYFFPIARAYWQKAVLALMGVFAIIIIMATGRRTGYVATTLFFIYYIYGMKINKLKATIFLILIAGLTVYMAPPEYQERFISIFTQEDKEGASTETRQEILQDAIEVYKAYPLGVGVAAFPFVRAEMFGRSQDTHNLYLEILTNTGPIGLLIFIMLIAKILSINRNNIKKNQEKIYSLKERTGQDSPSRFDGDIRDHKFLIAVSQSVIGFILVRLLLGLFGMDLYEIYWWLAIGLTLSVNTLTYQK